MKVFFSILLFFTFFHVKGQIYDPVEFWPTVRKIDGDKIELIINTNIDSGWHLYSQYIPDEGPIPTEFDFKSDNSYDLEGEVIEPEGEIIDDPIFEMRIKYFSDSVEFKQVIQRKSKDKFSIKLDITFMVCNDENCLPPTTKSLIFEIEKDQTQSIDKTNKEPFDKESENRMVSSNVDNTSANKQSISDSTKNIEKELVKIDSLPESTEDKTAAVLLGERRDTLSSKNKYEVSDGEIRKNKKRENSLLTVFIISFLGGFAALLTPCVFPMIPLTVSFFTKQSKSRLAGIKNAVIYGLSIIIIYILLGSLVTIIFGADALNALSTNVWFNLLFFFLLITFALSFMGAFELMLPSGWGTKLDSGADRGGIIGIFLMALALAVVSFSCTGPIVGTLLVKAASEGGIAPIIGMFGFSLAIALPFSLFAAFPGWLNSLPRSGGWLNTVKVVLGFLELALAFKFLSNTDLVLQLHLLERETFLAIWIAVFGVLSIYLFGKIKLKNDDPSKNISVGRLCLGIFVLSFTIYLIPGLWGAPLHWISGFPPPIQYSESPYGIGKDIGLVYPERKLDLPIGAELGPHNITVFKDYNTGMAYAKKVNKPVLLDFTGYACVNCRKMEERIWSDTNILDILKNDLILISLYVDDKTELPEDQKYVSKATGKQIKTVGNKWSDFQIERYGANAQPYYVVIDTAGSNLNEPVGYEPDKNVYLNWLSNGVKSY